MTRRRWLPIVASVLLCVSCAVDIRDDSSRQHPSRTVTTSSAGPSPTQSDTDTTGMPSPSEKASNRSALRAGTSLLRKGGVRAIGEAEPPHGDTDAELTGQWGNFLVIAHVAPEGTRLVPGDVLSSQETGGVQVLTMKLTGRRTVLRFDYNGFVIDLQVVTDNLDFLERESASLLSGILCPSECGALPPGADG